ncbi:MAG: hypothetical protein JOY78_06600 [Pseudonocardia sp.]|nr:hypothetical protein [Pseudonocardia sp.]
MNDDQIPRPQVRRRVQLAAINRRVPDELGNQRVFAHVQVLGPILDRA